VAFSSPSKDPWYAVSDIPMNQVKYVDGSDESEDSISNLYYTTEPASPLACMQQYQYCNPNLPEEPRCTRLSSQYDATYEGYDRLFGGSDSEINRFLWYDYALTNVASSLNQVVQDLGAQSMSSRSGLSLGFQGPLPDNQWQVDVAHWFSVILASLQNSVVSLAKGPPSDLARWKMTPNNTEETYACKNQVSCLLVDKPCIPRTCHYSTLKL
jgi:hypothetical protein